MGSTIFTLLTTSSLVVLCILIFFSRTTRNLQKFYFASFSASISIFLIILSISNEPTNPSLDLLLNRSLFFLAPIFTAQIYFLLKSLYKQSIGKAEQIVMNAGAFVLGATSLTPFVIQSVDYSSYESGIIVTRGSFYIPFVLIAVIPIFASILGLRKEYKQLSGTTKLRLRIVTLSFSGISLGFLFTNVVLPLTLGNSSTAFLAPVWILIWSLSLFYSIARYRLFGVRYIIGKILYYITNAALLFFIFYIVSVFQIYSWGGIFNSNAYLSGFFLAILVFGVFKYIDKHLSEYIEGTFGLGEKDIQESLAKYQRNISKTLDIHKVSSYTFDLLRDVLNVDQACIMNFERGSRSVVSTKYSESSDSKFGKKDNIIEVIDFWDSTKKAKILFKDELAEEISSRGFLNHDLESFVKNIHKYMEGSDIEVLAPLNRKTKLNGVLIIQNRNIDKPYTLEEVQILEQIISNLSLAFVRALLYHEVQTFNQTLKQKVDLATEELNEKVKALEEARRKERDMIDIMGHELRTPLSILRSTFGLIQIIAKKNEAMGKSEKFRKYFARMDDALQREIRLVETMLSSAKLDGDRMELHLEKVNVAESIDNSIISVNSVVEGKGIKIDFDRPKDAANVYVDKVRLSEILDNFIGNAVKYTEKGTVTIKISETPDEDMYKVSITDTGVGIPEDEIPNLGRKFYRVKQYIGEDDETPVVRPGGTGLGLYVAYSLVKLMGGKVEVKSTLGVGSTFSFTMPKYTNQESADVGGKKKNVFERLGFTEKPK